MKCKIEHVVRPDAPYLEDQFLMVFHDHGGIALIAHMLVKNVYTQQSIWSNSPKEDPDA